MLRCAFCRHAVAGLTLYGIAGVFRLMVCKGCYAQLLAKERQPSSRWMRQLREALRNMDKEVVPDEGSEVIEVVFGALSVVTHSYEEIL